MNTTYLTTSLLQLSPANNVYIARYYHTRKDGENMFIYQLQVIYFVIQHSCHHAMAFLRPGAKRHTGVVDTGVNTHYITLRHRGVVQSTNQHSHSHLVFSFILASYSPMSPLSCCNVVWCVTDVLASTSTLTPPPGTIRATTVFLTFVGVVHRVHAVTDGRTFAPLSLSYQCKLL